MAKRIASHFKYAGVPAPRVGSAGINVTSQKCLPANRQLGILGFVVNVLGAIQSVMRWLLLRDTGRKLTHVDRQIDATNGLQTQLLSRKW